MSDLFDRFNDGARRVVVLAQEEARGFNHNYFGTEHLLLGMLHEGDGVAAKALEGLGISLEACRHQLEEFIGRGQQRPKGHLPFTPRAKKVLELSLREALQLSHNHIGTEHILLSLIREGEGVAAQILVKLGADLNRVRQQVIQLLSGHQAKETTAGGPAKGAPSTSPVLDQLTHELRFGPVIGREKEIERVVQILARQQRNVPLLIGEPGVGKGAVAAGLAQAIVSSDVPPALAGRSVRSLDLAGLLTDPQHRGRAVAVVDALLREVRHHPALVLFLRGALNPVHMPDGTTNAFALFQSLFGRPGVFVLGATTQAEYRRRDPHSGLDQLIQTVPVDEPSPENVLEILKGVRDRLGRHHQVGITDAALQAAASLARDHVPDQLLPGAAIDLLDEASAQARVRAVRSAEVQSYDEQIAQVRRVKEEAIDRQDFDTAAMLRDQEKQLLVERSRTERERNPRVLEITESDVVTALAVYSGTKSPAPSRPTAAPQIPPAEHDPYIWSMS